MLVTIICAVVMMAGLFLLLLAGVGFIQDKRFFSSAPKETRDVVPDTKPERFRGQHALGWAMGIFGILMMIGAPVFGAVNGIQNDFTFRQFYVRFVIMLVMVKAFDIVFFDWVLLCNGGFNFFPHFYPETKDVLSPKIFGYNWKTHAAHIIGGAAALILLAWICTLF